MIFLITQSAKLAQFKKIPKKFDLDLKKLQNTVALWIFITSYSAKRKYFTTLLLNYLTVEHVVII